MRTGWAVVLSWLATAAGAATFQPQTADAKPIEARVRDYTVQADLGNVSNARQAPKLTDEQRRLLAANGFVARPTAEEQLFSIYENNHYKRQPSFVTTDSVLHTYHIAYDFVLRSLEAKQLLPAARSLCRRMFDTNRGLLDGALPPPVRDAVRQNVVFFAVPLRLLGEKVDVPAVVATQVDAELARIEQHGGWFRPATGPALDYSQFIPRGHYTRTEDLKRYFRAMMWLGLVPFPLDDGSAALPTDDAADRARFGPVRQALLITRQLAADDQARALWRKVYEPTAFMVGVSDDLGFEELDPLRRAIFGGAEADAFADPALLARFEAEAAKHLRKPGIATAHGTVQGQQFRFMGQRFILDSRIFQELVTPKVAPLQRLFPLALDVWAVMGNPRAADLLDNLYKEPRYANYLEQRAKLQAEVAALTPSDWAQNLYYGWLNTLRPLQTPHGAGWPSFMRNQAWQDKSLVTTLGSWTELRHDTILYAKQSTSECGGDGAEPPPPVIGYVEPEVEVYERLAALLRATRDGLKSLGLFAQYDSTPHDLDEFVDTLNWLATVSRKELRGETLSRDDLKAIEDFGGQLEYLMLAMARLDGTSVKTWWDIQSKTDKSMALIADVHTGGDKALEEAVGNAAEIWVVVPYGDKLVLTRGATFTWYEFLHPIADRLTDEAWQKQLRDGKQPGLPQWVKSYLTLPGVNTPTARHEMELVHTGC